MYESCNKAFDSTLPYYMDEAGASILLMVKEGHPLLILRVLYMQYRGLTVGEGVPITRIVYMLGKILLCILYIKA